MAEVTKIYDYVNKDELFQWIDEQVSEKIVKDIINSKMDYCLVETYTVDKFCKKYIKQVVDSFLKNNNIDVECTEQVYDKVCWNYSGSHYGNSIIDKSKKALKQKITFSYDLIDTDDNIGDVTKLNDAIDLCNRDGNFIIIGDKLIIGDNETIHSQLINKYIEECLNNDTNEEVEYDKVRDLKAFDGISNDEPVVFGHIVDNMAFIETLSGYTANEAVNILKNQGSFEKIYNYDSANNRVTRLAKKI